MDGCLLQQLQLMLLFYLYVYYNNCVEQKILNAVACPMCRTPEIVVRVQKIYTGHLSDGVKEKRSRSSCIEMYSLGMELLAGGARVNQARGLSPGKLRKKDVEEKLEKVSSSSSLIWHARNVADPCSPLSYYDLFLFAFLNPLAHFGFFFL